MGLAPPVRSRARLVFTPRQIRIPSPPSFPGYDAVFSAPALSRSFLSVPVQDIAVDGWALTLLSQANVSYASTCQTVGQTTGIFTSFTVFLALQDAAFCNRFIRSNKLLGRYGGTVR